MLYQGGNGTVLLICAEDAQSRGSAAQATTGRPQHIEDIYAEMAASQELHDVVQYSTADDAPSLTVIDPCLFGPGLLDHGVHGALATNSTDDPLGACVPSQAIGCRPEARTVMLC